MSRWTDETGRTSNIGIEKIERFKMRRNFEQELGGQQDNNNVPTLSSNTSIMLISLVNEKVHKYMDKVGDLLFRRRLKFWHHRVS